MPTKDRSWLERKVRELAEALQRLPGTRQRAVVEALEADRDPAAHQGTARPLERERGESGAGTGEDET